LKIFTDIEVCLLKNNPKVQSYKDSERHHVLATLQHLQALGNLKEGMFQMFQESHGLTKNMIANTPCLKRYKDNQASETLHYPNIASPSNEPKLCSWCWSVVAITHFMLNKALSVSLN